MKKALVVFIAILFVAAAFTACGSTGKTDADPASFKTIGDLLQSEAVEERQSGYSEKNYVYVYELDGTFYRAVAALSEEASAQLNELDILADDYAAKLTETISPLEITRLENLSETLPSQEELNKWVGKTGKDLFDADWTNSGWNLDEMVFWMNYGAFQYDVVMEGEVKDADDFSDEDIETLVVKSVTPNGQLGDATEIDE